MQGDVMKKYQTGGGIRQGKARFGDDVRERARKYIEEQQRMKERGVEAMPVKEPRKIPAKSLDKPKDKKEAPKTEAKKSTKPKMTATEAIKRIYSDANLPKPRLKKEPGGMGVLGLFMDESDRKKKGGSVKMAKGGSVSKRADGCAMKGKTKGRII